MTQIETEINGKVIVIPKWKYLLNWWSPILGIITMLVIGTIWFGSLNEKIFDNAEQKYKIIKHPDDDNIHLTKTQRDALVDYKDFNNLKEQLKSMDNKLDEINRYLRRK